MTDEIPAGESRDGKGAGDHDSAYVFGNARAGLTTMQQVHLTIMRGIVLDVSHAPASIRDELRYGGDNADLTELTQTGVWIAKFWKPDIAEDA